MSLYSVHAWGIDITEVFSDLERRMEAHAPEFGDLKQYIEEEMLGESEYDGGGHGQVSFLGVLVPREPRGYRASDAAVQDTARMLANLPPALDAALRACFGGVLPEPRFIVREGWG